MNALKILKEYFSLVIALSAFWLFTLTWIVVGLYRSNPPPPEVLGQMVLIVLFAVLVMAAASAVLAVLVPRYLSWDPKQTAPFLWRVNLCINPPIPAMLFIGLYYAVKNRGPVVLRYLASIIEDVGKSRQQPFH
jgi:hypothetical protein